MRRTLRGPRRGVDYCVAGQASVWQMCNLNDFEDVSTCMRTAPRGCPVWPGRSSCVVRDGKGGRVTAQACRKKSPRGTFSLPFFLADFSFIFTKALVY